MGFIKKVDEHTYEPYDPYNGDTVTKEDIQNAANEKLYNIEEAEREMGIPFLVLYNAIKYGFYDKDGDYYEPWDYSIELGSNCLKETFEDYMNGKSFNFEDYRKTWALTKEELELPY